jgi:hypothetical protein
MHSSAFEADPSVTPHCGVVKHLSPFPVAEVVETQYLVASHNGPSTVVFVRHKQATVFSTVPSLLVHSAALVHSLPADALVLHQFAPEQVTPEPHSHVPGFSRSPVVFPHVLEAVQRSGKFASDRSHIWFSVQTGAFGSVAAVVASSSCESPHVKRDVLITIPSPCAVVASAGLKHLTLGSIDSGRLSQCWLAPHSVPPQLHLVFPFCVDPSWLAQSAR